MLRVSVGWRNILHVVGGQMQYSVTHPGERVRKRYSSNKGMGVGSDRSFSPPSYLLRFLSASVDLVYNVQYYKFLGSPYAVIYPGFMG